MATTLDSIGIYPNNNRLNKVINNDRLIKFNCKTVMFKDEKTNKDKLFGDGIRRNINAGSVECIIQ